MEYHTTGVYEEAIDRLSTTDTEELRVQDDFVFILLERVPSFSPREVVRGHHASFPAICRWAVLLPQQGGGRTNESFDDDFFVWFSWQIPVIEDYPYVGIDFSRDPEIPVPPGEE